MKWYVYLTTTAVRWRTVWNTTVRRDGLPKVNQVAVYPPSQQVGTCFFSVVTRLSSRVVAVVSKEILSLYLGQYTQVTRIQLLLYLL